MALKHTFVIKEALPPIKQVAQQHSREEGVMAIQAAEEALLNALEAAGECPGCWYDDANGGAFGDHDDGCQANYQPEGDESPPGYKPPGAGEQF